MPQTCGESISVAMPSLQLTACITRACVFLTFVVQVDGAIISQVLPDTPAADAGLRRNDVVTEMRGRRVRTSDEAKQVVDESSVGDVLTLKVSDLQERTRRVVVAGVSLADARLPDSASLYASIRSKQYNTARALRFSRGRRSSGRITCCLSFGGCLTHCLAIGGPACHDQSFDRHS